MIRNKSSFPNQIYFLSLLWILLSIPLHAQRNDSVQYQLELRNAKILISDSKIDSAIAVLTRIASNTENLGYWELHTEAKIELARLFELRQDFENTLKSYIELIRKLERNDRSDQLAITYLALGADYAKYKLYNKAIRYYALAGMYSQETGNLLQLAQTMATQSDLYLLLENYEMADSSINEAITILQSQLPESERIPYLQKQAIIYDRLGATREMLETNLSLLEMYKRGNDQKAVIDLQNTIGYNYAALSEYKKALSIFLELFEAIQKVEVADSVHMNLLTNIGIAYSALDLNDIAIDTLTKVEAFYKKGNLTDKLAKVQDLMAEIYLKADNITAAREYSVLSIENARIHGDLSIIRDCYKTLSDIYQESDDFKNGLKYYELYSSLNDSITSLASRRKSELNQRESNVAIFERTMIRMVMDEELEELALENLRIESERYQKEIALLKANDALETEANRRKLLIIIFFFVTILLGLIVIGYLNKKKDNKLLLQQKASILAINKELKKMNEDLQDALEQLKMTQSQLIESEKMASLGQLTAGIAHEINNPVNFISSNINPLRFSIKELMEILETYRKSSEAGFNKEDLKKAHDLEQKYDLDYLVKELNTILKGIADGAERTKEIVLGLRNFSRIDKHVLKEAYLPDMIDSTLLLLRNSYKDRIEIEKSYANDIPSIACYPGQLSQVFMNVLNNAIQAIEGKGKIEILTERTGDFAKIVISDNGKGIPLENQDNIFEPFFTTKEVGEGTGLGLSIAYGIVQDHNGKIDLESKPGEGTRFTITIPIRLGEAKP